MKQTILFFTYFSKPDIEACIRGFKKILYFLEIFKCSLWFCTAEILHWWCYSGITRKPWSNFPFIPASQDELVLADNTGEQLELKTNLVYFERLHLNISHCHYDTQLEFQLRQPTVIFMCLFTARCLKKAKLAS